MGSAVNDPFLPLPTANDLPNETPQKERPVEILVRGLPLDVKEFDLAEAYGRAAPVLKVRLVAPAEGEVEQRAYLQFADGEQALKAAQSIYSFRGSIIAAEIVEALPYMCLPKTKPLLNIPIRPPSDPTDPVAIVLAKMRDHPDPKALVAASLNGAMNEIAGLNIGKEFSDEDEEITELKTAAVLKPEMAGYLDKFPSCKALVVKIRSMPNNDNKTPIAVLNEYAKRTGIKVDYDIHGDAHVGPFFMECRVTSSSGDLEYAVGHGEASNKKEAKQAASASAIEMLLRTTREVDFMRPARSKVFGAQAQSWPNREGGRASPYYSRAKDASTEELADAMNYPGW